MLGLTLNSLFSCQGYFLDMAPHVLLFFSFQHVALLEGVRCVGLSAPQNSLEILPSIIRSKQHIGEALAPLQCAISIMPKISGLQALICWSLLC